MAVITDLGHPAFAVQNVERTLTFYTALGIRESFRLNHADGSLMLAYLHVGGDRFIEIFPGAPQPDDSRKSSFMHLCLLTDDLHGMVERLRGAGIPIDQEPKMGLDHNWQAWTHDPDGNPIEFMQIMKESPQWKTAHGE